MALLRLRGVLRAGVVLIAAIGAACVLIHVALVVLYAPLPDYGEQTASAKPSVNPMETVLNLPLSFPVSDLREAAERYTPKSYTDEDRDFTDMLLDDTLTYDLARGPIAMEIQGDGIAFSFPVSGQVRARGFLNFGVSKVKTSAHAEVAGIISGRIAFKILPDWRIEPDIDYHVNITKALIPIKGIGDISLRTFLEDKLSHKIQSRKKKLTEKIMGKDIIRSEVSKVWKKMHRVEKIKNDPAIWARVIPRKVGFLPLYADGKDTLKIGITMALETDLVLSDDSPVLTVSDLPDAEILKNITDDFSLHVPVFADMASVNRYVGSLIDNRTISLHNGFLLSFTRADLLSSGNNQLSAVVFARIRHQTFGLATECRLYVHGRVDYDPDSGMIRYSNLIYDAVFSRPIVQALHWVLSPYIRYRLESCSAYPLNRELTKAHDAINKWIKTLVIPPGVTPNLSFKPPKLLNVTADRNGLSTDLVLQGNISAKLTFPGDSSQHSD